jgi:hypothetical protein
LTGIFWGILLIAAGSIALVETQSHVTGKIHPAISISGVNNWVWLVDLAPWPFWL